MPGCGNNPSHIKKYNVKLLSVWVKKNTTMKMKTFKLYKLVLDVYLDLKNENWQSCAEWKILTRNVWRSVVRATSSTTGTLSSCHSWAQCTECYMKSQGVQHPWATHPWDTGVLVLHIQACGCHCPSYLQSYICHLLELHSESRAK